MKILVLGSNGMAGHMITNYLKQQGHHVETCARNNANYIIDIEKTLVVLKNLISKEFDYIINCIGVLIGEANKDPSRAVLVNSYFPHYLEQTFYNTSTKLIHLSTDCVFDGQRGNYVESDIHTEMNFYGKSKSLGEINNNKDITFRMSIIGPELKTNGTGLLHWILNNSNDTLDGWDNAWWNGITTLQLAKCIETYIKNPVISGVYHLVNNEVYINKYELLCKVNNIYNLNKNIRQTKGPKTVNKVLIDTKNILDFNIPNYDKQLKELKEYSRPITDIERVNYLM